MIPRHLSSRLIEALADTPVVVLVGAGQSGKTTLVRSLRREEYPASYLSLDDPATLGAAQADPAAFLADLDGPVILDEVQRVPALFPVLRSAVDRHRVAGRFLLTGSAHVLIMPGLAEALVGRMEALTLWPLSQGEIERCREGFVDALFRERLPAWKGPPAEARGDFLARVLVGGYPEPTKRGGHRRQAWFRSYVAAILQREVRELAAVEGLHTMPRLLGYSRPGPARCSTSPKSPAVLPSPKPR